MWTIIRKETLENMLTMRFAIGFAACFLVFGLIFYVLMNDFLLEWEGTQAARHQADGSMAEWESYSFVRPTVIKEPSLLAVFGDGMGRQWGRRVWISHTRIPVFTSDETSSGTRADFLGFFSSFDFTHVVLIFVTLLALLFSFDAVSGEKQRGTLRLLLSNPRKRTGFFIGKYIGSLLALVPIVLAAFLLVLLILVLKTPAPPGVDEWISLAVLVLATLLLGAAFSALGMLISSLTQKTATSLIVSMIIWVLFVLVYPSAVGFLSSEFGFKEDSREFDRSLLALYEEYRDGLRKLGYQPRDYMMMANFYSRGEGEVLCRMMGDKAIAFFMSMLPEAIERQNEFATRRYALESQYYATREAKTALTENLLRISPASLYGNIVNALARTDAAAHSDFMEQTRRYRDDIVEFIRSSGGYTSQRWFTSEVGNPPYRALLEQAETMTLSEMGGAFNDPELLRQFFKWIEDAMKDPKRKLDLSGMPRFQMKQRSAAEALGSVLLDILLLVIFTCVCIVISYIKFSTYDVR